MGGIVSGPVIRFSIDQAALEEATKQAFSNVNAQIQAANKTSAAQIAQQIADPLQAQAAKLRALYSTGALGLQALQVQQKALISSIDAEIAKLVTRNDLTAKELATLKQMTLERERQQNAVNRGVGVGITAGTGSALQQGASGIIANISKLGTGLLGLSGASGAESAVFSGAAAGISAISASAGTAVVVLGGLTLALGAAGIAAIALGKKGTDLVLELINISHQTGISVQNLQVLQAQGEPVGVGLDAMVIGFKKFSQAVTGESGGEGAGFENAGKKAVEVLKALGVTSKDPITALEQTYNALSKLPDGFTKDAAAVELFGKSALRLIPVIDQGAAGFQRFQKIVQDYGPTITENVVDTTERAREAQVKFNQEIQKVEVSLIPVIGKIIEYGEAINKAISTPAAASKFSAGDAFAGGYKTLSQIPDTYKSIGASIGSITPQLDKLAQGFSAGEVAANKMGDALKRVLSGETAQAIKDRAEAAQMNAEILARAADKITEINAQSLTFGLSPEDKTLEEEQLKLEKIAEIMLNFPSLAGEASTAAKNVVTSTINELTLLADKSLKEIQTKNDESNKIEENKARELVNLLTGIEGDLGIDRAKIAQNAVQTIIAEEQKRLTDSLAKAAALGATEQDLQKLRILYNQDANAKIATLQTEQIKKTQDAIKTEAGKIFDTLISDPKNIGAKLKDQFLQIVTAPVKSVFENVFATFLTPFVTQAKGFIANIGTQLKGQGGLLGTIGTALSGVAGGTNPAVAATTLNTTATDANTAAITGLTGTLSGTTTAGSGFALSPTGGFSGIDNSAIGAALGYSPAGPGESSSKNSNPIGVGNTPDATSLANVAALANFAIGAVGLISNLTSGHASASQIIGNSSALLGGGLQSIGKSLNNSSLQTVGQAIGGAGNVIGGIASSVKSGGIGGVVQAGIGGAELGALFGGPIGAVIGGIAGAIAGGIGDLFHHGISQAQIDAAVKRQSLSQAQLNALQGVTFDNAVNGNFSQTARTGFSEGPGGVFSTFGTNNTQQPFPVTLNYSPVIQAFDQNGVNAVLAQHGTQIAQKIGQHIASTSSGLGRNIRTAVNPA